MATNAERSQATQQRLVRQARALFATQGYAATSTESVLTAAGVKRGALYHHFVDKAALFEAVCRHICEEAREAIEHAVPPAELTDSKQQLVEGSIAWISFMLKPDIRQIIMIDAPTVLGWQRWQTLEQDLSTASLREGIAQAIREGHIARGRDPALLTAAMNGALNGLAMAVGTAVPPIAKRQWALTVRQLWAGVWT
jgi:AcrR family transcriptional regulator